MKCDLLYCKKRPLNDFEGEVLKKLILAEIYCAEKFGHDSFAHGWSKLEDRINSNDPPAPLMIKVGFGRLKHHFGDSPVWLSPEALLYLASVAKTPGEAVMWVYNLAKLAMISYPVPVTLGGLALGIGLELPTDEAYYVAWSDQKAECGQFTHTDNLLDVDDTWKEFEKLRSLQKTNAN